MRMRVQVCSTFLRVPYDSAPWESQLHFPGGLILTGCPPRGLARAPARASGPLHTISPMPRGPGHECGRWER